MSERAETGPMQFGDDWPGVFIRGDNAGYFAMSLRLALSRAEVRAALTCAEEMALEGLMATLAGSDVRDETTKQMVKPWNEAKV